MVLLQRLCLLLIAGFYLVPQLAITNHIQAADKPRILFCDTERGIYAWFC